MGIGTTSPAYKLDILTTEKLGIKVTGTASDLSSPLLDFFDTTNSVDVVFGANGAAGAVGTFSNHPFQIITNHNNTPIATFLVNGNVGIGTASPSNLLTLSRNASDGFAHLTLLDTQGGSSTYYISNGAYGVGTFAIGDGTSRLAIKSGNVGIGTTSPGTKLDVNGPANIGGGTYVSNYGAVIRSSTNNTYESVRLLSLNQAGYADIGYAGINANISGFKVVSPQTEIWGTSTGVRIVGTGFGTTRVLDAIDNSGNVLFLVRYDGNVGIGSTSPTEKISINGNLSFGPGNSDEIKFVYTAGGSPVTFQLTRGGTEIWHVRNNNGFRVAGSLDLGANSVSAQSGALVLQRSTRNNLVIDTGVSGAGATNGDIVMNLPGAGDVFTINNSSAAEIFRFTEAGNVGIGTTTPGAKLEVNGNIGLSSTGQKFVFGTSATDVNNSLYRDASTGDSRLDGAAGIQFITNIAGGAVSAMKILSSGNVGIGTTTPGAKLEVNGNIGLSSTGQKFVFGTSATDVNNSLYRDASTGDSRLDGAAGIQFITNIAGGAVSAMKILSSGNVGIGTTSPGVKLDVNYSNTTAYSSTAYNFAANRFYNLHNSGGAGQYASILLQVSGDNTNNNAVGQISALQESAGSSATSLTFQVRNAASSYLEGMRIASTGNVGIGTTSPGAPLTIAHEASYTFPNPGTSAKGAINIRATTGSKETGITFSRAGVDDAQAGIYVTQDNSNGTHMYFATTSNYGTGPQVRQTILNNGNVGIGTTSPAAKLHVSETWNNSGVTFTGLKVSVTDPAANAGSAAGSKLLDLLGGTAGTTSKFSIRKDGLLFFESIGLSDGTSGYLYLYNGTIAPMFFSTNGAPQIQMGANGIVAWTGVNDVAGTSSDTKITRPSAGLLSIDNGTIGSHLGSLTANNLTLGGTLLLALGAVGTPSLSFTSDTNTGLWSSGADTLNFSTGGSERVRIDSSGNVGIGTTSPAQKLQVSGKVIVAKDDDSATAGFQITTPGDSPPFRITNSARSTDLYLQWASEVAWIDATSGFRFESGSGDVGFTTNGGSYRLIIKQTSGNVGIGTTSPSTLF